MQGVQNYEKLGESTRKFLKAHKTLLYFKVC